jgi:hypothetical protein
MRERLEETKKAFEEHGQDTQISVMAHETIIMLMGKK